MPITPIQFPELLNAISSVINENAESVTELDQAIGDGDHVYNLQRGIDALQTHSSEIACLDWPDAWQKIGMTVMAAIGGASGSLYATMFISLAKNSKNQPATIQRFAYALEMAIEAVKQRGKADVGEKTMLDVWVPVAHALKQSVSEGKTLSETLDSVCSTAEIGVESTREMLATKGRASFLGERSRGHIDAGAKTAQLMIHAISSKIKADLLC
jgi:dihydroxyacetone kinase-like protein